MALFSAFYSHEGGVVTRHSLGIAGGVLACVCVAASSANAARLVLHLSVEKTHIAAREPVKLRVRLSNESEGPAYIMTVSRLTTNMLYMYLIVTPPGGVPEKRKFVWQDIYEYVPQKYKGELLRPHESVETFLYPNFTRSMETYKYSATFSESGQYEVQVVYSIPGRLALLDDAGTDLVSNMVTVDVRTPTPVEEEILDACWSQGGGWLSVGEGYPDGGPERALKEVISKYPNEPMTRYADEESKKCKTESCAETRTVGDCKLICVTGLGVYSIKGEAPWPSQIPPTS